MDNYGFIHDKTDIKLLILYFLKDLPDVIEHEELFELCTNCDGGIGYFAYSDCTAELVAAGQITEDEIGYAITEKGRANLDVLKSSLPYSVRSRADKLLEPAIEKLLRRAMINASYNTTGTGTYVKLSVSDGQGAILKMDLLCGSEDQAKKIKKNFRLKAEEYYQNIIELLSAN